MKKKILFKIIKLCPFNFIRVFIYRFFFNYKIGKNIFIGNSILNCNAAEIADNVIIKHNVNIRCKKLKIGKSTSILSNNSISGSADFSIGNNSRIINHHHIDVYNNVSIGNNTWIAGKGSQIWTHGSLYTKLDKDLSVKIGDDIYIGTNVNIAPGTIISNLNLIGMGSVVSGKFLEEQTIIAGNPAKVIKTAIDWRDNW